MKLSPSDYREVISDLLGRGRACETRMRGKSMRPTVEDGDLVVLRKLDPDDLRPGDIVLFVTSDGYPVCHRVVRVSGAGEQRRVQTWGDAIPWPDLPVPMGSVLGRVESVKSGDGEVSREALVSRFRLALLRRRLALLIPGLIRLRHPRTRRRCTLGGPPRALRG